MALVLLAAAPPPPCDPPEDAGLAGELVVAGAAADGAVLDGPGAAGAADAADDGFAARDGFNTAGVELVVERLPISIVFPPRQNGPSLYRLSAGSGWTLELF